MIGCKHFYNNASRLASTSCAGLQRGRSNAGMSMFVIQVVIYVAYVIMSQTVYKRFRAEKYMG